MDSSKLTVNPRVNTGSFSPEQVGTEGAMRVILWLIPKTNQEHMVILWQKLPVRASMISLVTAGIRLFRRRFSHSTHSINNAWINGHVSIASQRYSWGLYNDRDGQIFVKEQEP